MKGILLKDFWALRKTIGLYVLMTVVLSATMREDVAFFAMFYAVMLPVNLIAMDERSHFERLMVMLPLTGRQCVLDKYLIGYAGFAFATVASGCCALFTGGLADLLQEIPLVLGLCLIVHGVMIPLVLRFGIERGRMIYVFAMIVLGGLLGSAGYVLGDRLAIPARTLSLFVFPAGVACNVLSIWVSQKVYMNRLTV